jgi:hypothetical protein
MRSKLRLPRKALTALPVGLVLAFVVPASAMATSTTVTPAGDSFTVGSSTLKIDWHLTGGPIVTCAVTGMTGSVPAAPANHNGSGAVNLSLGAKTLIEKCSTNNGEKITVSGGPFSKMAALGGASPTASTEWELQAIGAPGECANGTFVTLAGPWKNGTVSPLVDSSWSASGSYETSFGCVWGNGKVSLSSA